MTNKYSFRIEWTSGSETFSSKEKAIDKATKMRDYGRAVSLYMFVKGQEASTLTHVWDYIPVEAAVAVYTANAHLFGDVHSKLIVCRDISVANALQIVYEGRGYKATVVCRD